VGELAVLIVVRNPDVSPWFPMLLLVYPGCRSAAPSDPGVTAANAWRAGIGVI